MSTPVTPAAIYAATKRSSTFRLTRRLKPRPGAHHDPIVLAAALLGPVRPADLEQIYKPTTQSAPKTSNDITTSKAYRHGSLHRVDDFTQAITIRDLARTLGRKSEIVCDRDHRNCAVLISSDQVD